MSLWLTLTHRLLPAVLPGITLGAETLTPQSQVKWLGVILDQKLTFSPHGRALEKTGTRVVLQLSRLAGTGWGIPLPQCLRLISSLVHSRTDYAASVWHQYDQNTATVKAIQRIDNTAQRFAFGVFKTHPLIYLKHDTTSASALLRLNSKSQKALARLLSLPDTNPAAVLTRTTLSTPRWFHRTSLHRVLLSRTSTLANLPGQIERISLCDTMDTSPHPRIRALIASNKQAAKLFVQSQLALLTEEIPTYALSFSDGSLIPSEGVGVVVYLFLYIFVFSLTCLLAYLLFHVFSVSLHSVLLVCLTLFLCLSLILT